MRKLRADSDPDVTLGADRQNLPLPLSGLAPIHRRVSATLAWWYRTRGYVITGLGLVLVMAAATVALNPPAIAAYGDAETAHVGESVLVLKMEAANPDVRVYVGDATLAIVSGSDGLHAGGVATINGKVASGHCLLRILAHGSAVEQCSFDVADQRFHATDAYDPAAGRWSRRYDDGKQATFDVPPRKGLIPIPFPLGR